MSERRDGAGSRLRVRDDLLYRKLVDGGLIYDSSSGSIHHLNDSAALVWEASQEGCSAADIGDSLSARYEVDAGVAVGDAETILQRFLEAGLMHSDD